MHSHELLLVSHEISLINIKKIGSFSRIVGSSLVIAASIVHVSKINWKQRRSPSYTDSVYTSYVVVFKLTKDGLQLIRKFLFKLIDSHV